jgi:hypothetical protein
MLSNNQSPQVVINVSIKIIKEVPAQIEEVIHQVPNLPLDVVSDRLKDNDWVPLPDGQSFLGGKMDKKQCDSD